MPGAPVGGRPGGAARVLLFMHLGIRAGASARATSPTTPRATELRATRAPEVALRQEWNGRQGRKAKPEGVIRV